MTGTQLVLSKDVIHEYMNEWLRRFLPGGEMLSYVSVPLQVWHPKSNVKLQVLSRKHGESD